MNGSCLAATWGVLSTATVPLSLPKMKIDTRILLFILVFRGTCFSGLKLEAVSLEMEGVTYVHPHVS